MSNILEKSLDDIIGEKEQSHRRFIPTRRRGAPLPNHHRSSRFPPSRPSSRPIPINHRETRDSRDRDVYIPRSSSTTSSSIPKDVLQLANGRPTLRLKNIHPELNGEDLNNLFSTISAVDFIKFDDLNDTIAYICFQQDNDRSNQEAIIKYDGKKAMGKILIVENTTSVSLADRIKSNPIHKKENFITSVRPISRGGYRGNSRGIRGGSNGGVFKNRITPNPKKSADDLDKELDSYMNPNKNKSNGKKSADDLDKELESYMNTTNNDEMSVD
ncbi:hypothetical protein KGF54_004126 [Candida jiufengensis]|uniref:uncharacterized protein n=1 Tax=Candida jiufengensis TaxID=497108 RepID=UPI002223F008|nr:uncharacterized protein KGF54_004126 [Candida jiufengensis]KAI5951052.1 hypothetical protein KGF54_004126 [Candida jiufengensis]